MSATLIDVLDRRGAINGGLHVDSQFQFSLRLDRKIGGAGSVQYLVNVSCGTMEAGMKINSIANQPAGLHVYAIAVNSGNASGRSGSGDPCLF